MHNKSVFILSLVLILLGITSVPAFCHINDEVAMRTGIFFEDEGIALTLEIDAGMLFGQYYLEILDLDRDEIFGTEDVQKFSEFVVAGLRLRINDLKVLPEFAGASCASFEEFVAGFCYIKLCYIIPYPEDLDRVCTFYYENCLEAEIAIYSLSISDTAGSPISIIKEERNEILQDSVTITFSNAASTDVQAEVTQQPSQEPVEVAVVEVESKAQPVMLPETELAGSAMLINRLKTGEVNFLVLIVLAVVIGFLHAFTPGHGKSLVGAYLVANRGTASQALGLGLIVTLTHTASIYVFGGLASAAAYFFMPSKIVPVMTVVSGVLVVIIGIWSAVRRLIGLEVDHAHILPNLKVLKEDHINILVDGSAVESSEFLIIEAEEDWVQKQLQAAGAEGINICSPGCETHNFMPAIAAERQNTQLVMTAVETGAVDAIVSRRSGLAEKMQNKKSLPNVDIYLSLDSRIEAAELLRQALSKYNDRDGITIPEEGLSWKKLIPLGIAGGAVPCPDALAILLVSVSLGRVALGLGIVFAFSTGLAAALVLIGMTIVFSNKLISGTSGYRKIAGFLPYFSALFLIGLGVYMIINNIGF